MKRVAMPARTKPMTRGTPAKARTRKCACCPVRFVPRSMTHKACGPDCAAKVALAARLKAERKADAQRKIALKKRSQWIAEVQAACNALVRARDEGQTCIDCGKPFEPQRPGGAVDAGHYLSRSLAPHLRFDLRNIHAQRKNCNRPGGTTREAFRAGVEARIGADALAALEAEQGPAKWTIPDLMAMKADFQTKLKALKAERTGNFDSLDVGPPAIQLSGSDQQETF